MVAVTTHKAEQSERVAVVFSRGLRALRHLPVLAGVDQIITPQQAHKDRVAAQCVLVWGRKSNTTAALEYAARWDIPVVYLEDGWIRSSARNPHSRTCYSILLDNTGVYYDSRTPNDLENLLNLPASKFQQAVSEEQISYAKRCRTQLVSSNISKYNFTPEHAKEPQSKNTVLVIDQTRDDASVRYGGMDADGFEAMLQGAIDENPGAQVLVRSHPDVVSGRRQGYLTDMATKLGLPVSADASNPIGLLKTAAKVYVGTSQLGYEALLCDVPVVVFGQPFYSGWGLTDDRSPVSRRCQKRTIDELFHATHVALARYCNPITGTAWALHECLDHVELQQEMFKRNARDFTCVGITAWKQKYVEQYLRSPNGTVQFCKADAVQSKNGVSALLAQNSKSAIVTWGYRAFDNIEANAKQAVGDVPLMRFEDGFLRSTGLGSDFNAPASLVLDAQGLYFDPGRPSELESLLNSHDCTPNEIFRAVSLKKLILSARLSKYNLGTKSNLLLPDAGKPHLLVVGQVEDDQSIKRGCDKVRKNSELLLAVRASNPDAWIRYKPHPDVVAGNRKGAVAPAVLDDTADVVDADAAIVDCIDACDELHTMTSLSGFEALLRGKRVVTYGTPFYAGWGLTEDNQPTARRGRRRTLDELVYLSLIAYPRYVDIETGEFATPEDLVQTIISQRAMNKKFPDGWSARTLNKVVNIVRGLRYAP